jgi:hypothetical protein
VTLRAIGGLVVLNVFILSVGAGVLWGLRGWRWWTELVRLAGVAYLLGWSALMLVMTYELVLGIPVGAATVLLDGATIVALGVLLGRRRGFTAPMLRAPGWRLPRLSLLAAAFLAGLLVYVEGFFRAGRLAGVAREWDSWANWIPKAQEIFRSGRLEPDFLRLVQDLQLPSYPPGLATIQAAAFHAMGSADTATLHVQYWFFAVAFVGAAIGLLANRVHHAILFPVLLAFLVAPSLLDWNSTLYADIPLGYLVAVAALLVLLWIEEKEPWQLAAATVLVSGAMLVKREGLLFVACVVVAGFVASFAERRRLWPRLFVAGVAAVALVLPWRIWFMAHDLAGDTPGAGGGVTLVRSDRFWPSVEFGVATLFDQALWRFVPYVAAAAVLLALLAGAWRASLYAAVFFVSALASAAWVFWVNPGLGLTSDEWTARRFTGTTVLALAVLTPLLLQRAWSSRAAVSVREPPGPDAIVWRSRLAWGVVLLGVLSHPGAMLVGYSGSGLPGGWPSFPGSSSCAAAPVPGAGVRVVIGYADSYPAAEAMRSRAVAAGLEAAEVGRDECGRLRVLVDDVATGEASRRLAARAESAGLEPTVETDPDD